MRRGSHRRTEKELKVEALVLSFVPAAFGPLCLPADQPASESVGPPQNESAERSCSPTLDLVNNQHNEQALQGLLRKEKDGEGKVGREGGGGSGGERKKERLAQEVGKAAVKRCCYRHQKSTGPPVFWLVPTYV